ncbi:hypothetical protein BU26DRAFT_515313 [Trematosphaeria pertusa]|uniref:Ubiquitin 3 binding protein But2 C-terminal domain-containing protein n=1 Tax=Trematosphaeria pertusa TaxID=390896 RepID=A0A6A6IR03_9PLEO|nr:uncharacterized protein BU26DRAFT_515313 [Trematosphaeria pertusa]KAF2252891.1 hypothetical protein BU26DRAFT_515313 [Trematosphaeria pertusa]
MQFTTAVLAALSTVGALALPQYEYTDNSVIVQLGGDDELATQTQFSKVQYGQREEQMPVGSSGPFKTVNLEVGKGVQQQNLRCQVLDDAGKPIVLMRGANVDITFSDADKGEWQFRKESMVSNIICDPTFVAIDPSEKDVTIILSGPSELATQTTLLLGGTTLEAQSPTGSFGPYNTVELRVGSLVENQALRCQVRDLYGNPIIIRRGENTDITFSDAKKGSWAFLKPAESEVHAIICDPAFVAQKIIV